jgi:two-component system nitrate/nitrite sensor histidine kinase NarX
MSVCLTGRHTRISVNPIQVISPLLKKSPQHLSTKLIRTGLALLGLALISIGLTFYITRQLDGGAAAVNEAGRLRMQAWRLVAVGQQEPTLESAQRYQRTTQSLIDEFDSSMALLRTGDPSRPLFVPWDDASSAQFKNVDSLWRQLKQDRESGSATGMPLSLASRSLTTAEQFVGAIDTLVQQIETHMARLTALLNLFQFVLVALAIAGATIMLYTGYQFVLNPLARLRNALKRVEGGDLHTRIEEDGPVEFAEVAAVFNHMSATLHTLVGTLETRIAEKTKHLEAQRNRLAALYDVSTFLADTNSLEALAKGFAQKIRIIAGADASVCRWMDAPNQRFVLLADDALPDVMREEQSCLVVGSCACGQAPTHTRAHLIQIQANPHHVRTGCMKAGFSSIITVPMRLNDQTVGKVDLFYRQSTQLSQEELSLLDTLTSHLAGALEGLRLSALAREAAVSHERGLLAQELHDSIAQSLAFLKIQVQRLKGALQNERHDQVESILSELDTGIRDSTQDVRELMLHFRVRPDPDDFDTTVRNMLAKFSHQTGIQCHLQVSGFGYPLGPDVQLQVLHVLQEALSNVRKHAKANDVQVTIDKQDQWVLRVQDDGIGFDTESLGSGPEHIGLHIMRERAARIGASLQMQAIAGRGTTVNLTLASPHLHTANP